MRKISNKKLKKYDCEVDEEMGENELEPAEQYYICSELFEITSSFKKSYLICLSSRAQTSLNRVELE